MATQIPNPLLGKSNRPRDCALVGTLLFFSLALHGWILFNTEIPARDTIGFIRYALSFETTPWREVLATNQQHPAYPFTIYLLSLPVRAFSNMPLTDAMAFAAQLASGLAAVLLVIPMYFLGKTLFHQAAGFFAALMFQFLPIPAHILSDGLSEALFLLVVCTALLFAVLALRDARWWLFAICGIFSGLAYLTRPEGAVVVAATLFVLIITLVRGRTFAPRQSIVGGAALAAGALAVALPYVSIIGGFTSKPSFRQVLDDQSPQMKADAGGKEDAKNQPLRASILGLTLNLNDSRTQRAFQALFGIFGELIGCFQYFAIVPLLLGIWWFRPTSQTQPGVWVIILVCLALTLAVWRLAVQAGYFSDRHLLVLVMCGCFPAAAALWEIPKRFPLSKVSTSVTSVLLLLCVLFPGLPKTLESLHRNRAGYHAAGLWLQRQAAPFDLIEDEHCWAHYYAGHVFLEGKSPQPEGRPPVRYVVIGRRTREINLTWNRSGPLDERKLAADGGRIVYHWPTDATPASAPIVVYAFDVAALTRRVSEGFGVALAHASGWCGTVASRMASSTTCPTN